TGRAGQAWANVGRLTAGASANVAARATRRRRSMMIAVFNRHSPDEQSLRRSVDLVNSSSFPALRKDGLGMQNYHLLPQNPVLKASTVSPFHPRRPVTLWASDRVSLSASRRALPCLHRGGYTTHTVRSSARGHVHRSKQRARRATIYSITSSATASSVVGMSRPKQSRMWTCRSRKSYP